MMVCYSPLQGYRSRSAESSGKRKVVFTPNAGFKDLPVTLPCGQCTGCRLERSRQWAMRCYHEASLYNDNCFITLTYSDEFLPADNSLDLSAFQLFMKRLRKRFYPGIRFFHCGEYGEDLGRPHYHACLFNFDFPDKELFSIRNGQRYYTSSLLQELWPFGFSIIGDVTFESAAYVARYCVKKVTGYAADFHYSFIDPVTGEWKWRKPEYGTMSRRPGIGAKWLQQFCSDVYPGDFVVVRGVKMQPPRFYDGIYELTNFDDFRRIKRERRLVSPEVKANNTPDRLRVRERVKKAQLSHLKRGYENET